MEDLLVLIIALVVLVLLDAASIRFGADSRDGSHDPRQGRPKPLW